MQPAPFTPDALYCVYCHAPAAGQCAACHTLCCADCVEVVSGFVTPRAVCRSCLRAQPGADRRAARARIVRWALPAALLVLFVYWFCAGR